MENERLGIPFWDRNALRGKLQRGQLGRNRVPRRQLRVVLWVSRMVSWVLLVNRGSCRIAIHGPHHLPPSPSVSFPVILFMIDPLYCLSSFLSCPHPYPPRPPTHPPTTDTNRNTHTLPPTHTHTHKQTNKKTKPSWAVFLSARRSLVLHPLHNNNKGILVETPAVS
jgi:hypothetical protein